MRGRESRSSLLPGLAVVLVVTAYLIALLAVEQQTVIIALLGLAIVAVLAARWLGLLDAAAGSFIEREDALAGLAICAALAVAIWFYDNHFVLLLLNSVLL